MAIFIIVFCVILSLLLRLNVLRYRKKGLPPGTMGWPILGETSYFLKQGPNFMNNQRSRYGNIFKSHILGCPTIVSMDPDLNRFILWNESKGLIPGYPQSMLDILGKCNIAAVHGSTHKYIRASLHSIINPSKIRDTILPIYDHFMRSHLSNWQNHVIDIQLKTKEMAFFASLKQIAGNESTSIAKDLMTEFAKLVDGTISLPINLPGTNYHRGFQARKVIVNKLAKLIEEKRASKGREVDMLNCLLKEEDNNYKLNDEEIIDLIITLLYSGYETVSTTSMMAIKYLHDHPLALDQLRKEHLEIRAKKKPEDPINWQDYKAMKFTRAVILETSRLATIVNGVLRKTTKDMAINGFVIPKGWRIYLYAREVNYDPYLYPDPLSFNPWRWLDGSIESQHYFLAFGDGTRQCPGKELGIAEISTFLHYFLTRYKWEEIEGNKLLKFPRVEAPNGFRVKVSSY
ncbi:unnamed protein product [Amaranthus hypochondriacus]